MADQIVITEKTSQAKDIRTAVGSRYGDILPAEGHLFDLLEPEDVVPAWKRWSPILLRPEALYGTRPAEGGNKAAKLKAIREALRTAKRVWLATDCDREGQLIGQEILEHYEYRGQVMRVLFTAQDSQTIRDAFGRAKPNAEYASLYAAAVARRQADQIYNLSLTRTATVILGRGARRVIGVGRVKTPTLAIVCKRELEIRNFVPLAYFEIVATAKVAGGQFQMRHAPQARIVRREIAQEVVNAAQGFEGALAVRVEDKRQVPPKLHDLPSLQKLCGSRFGWSASKTLEVAQELYDGQGKKIVTYPRAEVRYLPQNLISDVPRIIGGLRVGQSFGAIPVPEPPVIRKGASGTFYDKGLEGASHHAVIPNVNTIDKLREVWPRLSSDEKKLFDVIARAYLAALMPDFRYRQTTATLDVRGFEFRASGRQPIDLGWRAAFPDWQPADEKGDEVQLLPALRNGETAQLHDPKIEDKETRPPPRYNEGTLIEAMQNAWRFVDDEVLRERLKEAKGIGTPATRAEIIGGLKKQGFLVAQGKHIVPTEAGLSLFGVLKQADPASLAGRCGRQQPRNVSADVCDEAFCRQPRPAEGHQASAGLQDVDIDLPKISQRTRAQESRERNAGEARLQTGKPGTDVVRQEDRAGERRRHSRGGQGQLGCHVRLDRLEPKREAPQARSQDRLQAGGISSASIDRDDEEVSETQTRRLCGSAGSRAAKFGYRYAVADSLWQQGGRSEAWRPLSLGWAVCPTRS